MYRETVSTFADFSLRAIDFGKESAGSVIRWRSCDCVARKCCQMSTLRGLLIDVCWQTRELYHKLQCVADLWKLIWFKALETIVPCLELKKLGSRNISIELPGMDARDSARDNVMYETENDQLIGKLIELERTTSALRLVQTLVILLERLMPTVERAATAGLSSLCWKTISQA